MGHAPLMDGVRFEPASSQSEHFVTTDLPHGIPLSLSLGTNSIWQFIALPPRKPVHMYVL